MSATHGGKGSSRRTEDRKKVEANWDAIFGKPAKEKESKKSLTSSK